jgi:threonine dehydrogenase-like Zn-dependent dehydrogenase
MRAIAVVPGKPDSVHLAELAKPSIDEVPGGRGVLVKVLRVGVDGTDKEINAAEYGAAPDGHQFLVIGHEGFDRVEAIGDHVTEVRPGDYVVATVRRPGTSLYDLIGTNDMTTDDTYFERGINLRHGYLTEYYVDDAEFIVKVPRGLREVGVLLEPLLGRGRRVREGGHRRHPDPDYCLQSRARAGAASSAAHALVPGHVVVE